MFSITKNKFLSIIDEYCKDETDEKEIFKIIYSKCTCVSSTFSSEKDFKYKCIKFISEEIKKRKLIDNGISKNKKMKINNNDSNEKEYKNTFNDIIENKEDTQDVVKVVNIENIIEIENSKNIYLELSTKLK